MKDRITLAVLIIFLWIFLVIFQKYTPVPSSIYIVIGFMGLYAILLHTAQYHQKRRTRKFPPKTDSDYKPFVSVLIPAYNEDTVIENTILNMLALDYPNYEIVAIDDRSTDGTASVLKMFAKVYSKKFKYIIRDKNALPGKSAVLNEALEIAKGEVICVFDADARVETDFLVKILPSLADSDVGAVQARKIISNNDMNLLTRCQNNEYALDAHFQAGRDSIHGAVELRGNGQLIKREALKDVEGWNINTLTDDLDISTRLHLKGWDIRFCCDTEVYEEGVLTLLPLLRQRRRWVEGSIRRYLEYFTNVLFSKDISLRVSIDMVAYISEFVLPVWLLSEWTIQGIKFIKGYENNIFSSIAVILAIFVFFLSGLIYSLRRYNKLSFWQGLKQSIETGIYMILIWTPVVSYIVFKIIFLKRTLDWDKTVHGVNTTNQEQVELSNA